MRSFGFLRSLLFMPHPVYRRCNIAGYKMYFLLLLFLLMTMRMITGLRLRLIKIAMKLLINAPPPGVYYNTGFGTPAVH